MNMARIVFEFAVTVAVALVIACIYVATGGIPHPALIGYTVAGGASVWLAYEIRRYQRSARRTR